MGNCCSGPGTAASRHFYARYCTIYRSLMLISTEDMENIDTTENTENIGSIGSIYWWRVMMKNVPLGRRVSNAIMPGAHSNRWFAFDTGCRF
jgi:hypothetical protein